MTRLLWIASGGAIGAVARWLLATAVQARATTAFPWGTLAVNVLGCLLIGVVGALIGGAQLGGAQFGGAMLDGSARPREELRLFVVIGVLGGFTTMSSFAWEAFTLAAEGARASALLYVVATNVLCLLAAFGGFRLVHAARAA